MTFFLLCLYASTHHSHPEENCNLRKEKIWQTSETVFGAQEKLTFVKQDAAFILFRKVQFLVRKILFFSGGSHFAKHGFVSLGKACLATKLSDFPNVAATLACHKMKTSGLR